MSAPAPYMAHEADVENLRNHWTAVLGGETRTVQLTGPLGAGKRALVGEICRTAIAEAEDDVLIWRLHIREEDDGMQVVLRSYATLFAGVQRSPAFRGKVEMALNSQIPNQPKRVQGWYQSFIEGLRKATPAADGKVQVNLPKDNPLVGLVEIATGIARKFPVILDINGLHNSHSVGLMAFLESLFREAKQGGRLLSILSMEPLDDVSKTWMSQPMQELFARGGDTLYTLPMTPWTGTEVGKYLSSRDIEANAEKIAEVAGGRPGFVAELIDYLKEQDKLDSDITDLTLASLVDLAPDASELEAPKEPAKEGERKYATAADADRIAHLAALLGVSFPSGLLADMGGFVRDSVDDIMDATDNVYKELQFSEPLGTWVYQFKRALIRESVLARHTGDEAQETGRRVAAFMERFLALITTA